MKNGLLICSGVAKHKNIGDYIQSLASEQYFDKINYLVEREELNFFRSPEKTKVIMNGWFMWNPENWPPSKDILPLFLSFHIVPDIAERMFTSAGIEYFKRHAPIGCRDYSTMEIFKKYNIPCYFSGCLTLTLGKSYIKKDKNEKVVFVDPYYKSSLRTKSDLFDVKSIVQNFYHLFKYYKIITSLSKKFNFEFTSGYRKISKKIDRLIQVTSFYQSYSKFFSDELLLSATYIGHEIQQSEFKNDIDKLNYARELMNIYAESSLVITSRIHCALPCLGVETPVLFVSSDNLEGKNPIRSKGRFGGILNLFHTLRYTPKGIYTNDEYIKEKIGDGKIGLKTKIFNKSDHIPLRDAMDKTCKKFVQKKL